jgi:hypothetical protein
MTLMTSTAGVLRDSFSAQMEAQFGTEAALGVYFKLADGTCLSAADYDALVRANGGAGPDAVSCLPGGGSAVCCTDYAALIYRALPGRVQIVGFANADNPASRIARELIHPGGHDFALVDGRFLVDPWPRLVPGVFEQMVFDLEHEGDAALVADIYGPRNAWRHMREAEQAAQAVAA